MITPDLTHLGRKGRGGGGGGSRSDGGDADEAKPKLAKGGNQGREAPLGKPKGGSPPNRDSHHVVGGAQWLWLVTSDKCIGIEEMMFKAFKQRAKSKGGGDGWGLPGVTEGGAQRAQGVEGGWAPVGAPPVPTGGDTGLESSPRAS